MQPTTKLSKNGWPIGKAEFRFQGVYSASANAIGSTLARRHKLGEFRFEPCLVFPSARISLERYGAINAFIAGFNFAVNH